MLDDDAFEYLTFGGTFGRAFSVFFDRLDLFMGISMVVMIPYAILNTGLMLSIGYMMAQMEVDPDWKPHHLAIQFVLIFFGILVYDLASVIGQGAITHGVCQIYLGRRPGWLQCIQKAWRKKYPLILSSLAVYGTMFASIIPFSVVLFFILYLDTGFAYFLAFLLIIAYFVGFCYVSLGVILTSPAVMTENFGPIKAITRSWELSDGSRCYLFCTMFCFWISFQIISTLLQNIFSSGDPMKNVFGLVGIVVSIAAVVFYFPLHSIIETVLYLNLRIGRESMNRQVLTGDLLVDEPPESRFRNDDQTSIDFSQDYRHVPLMDDDDKIAIAVPSTSVV